MKKYTVDFNLDLSATFEGIEAETEEEAREIAIEELLDSPEHYLDFSDPHQVQSWEEDDQ